MQERKASAQPNRRRRNVPSMSSAFNGLYLPRSRAVFAFVSVGHIVPGRYLRKSDRQKANVNSLVGHRSDFFRVFAKHFVELLAQHVAATEREREKCVYALEAMSEEVQIAQCAARSVDALLGLNEHAWLAVVDLST